MGRKDKKEYSLTAKQRKSMRSPKEDKAQDEVSLESEVVVKKNNSKRVLIIFIALILASVLILFAIILPFIINPYRRVKNPVAVITLSNSMKLEFEIFEEECPYAATNFIYLAKIGYFDGAVIYDMQNYFVRFGGFRDYENTHRATDTSFTDKITDITPPEAGGKFTYRLKKDSHNYASKGTEQGYLSFIYNDSATEFQFCVEDGASLDVTNGNGQRRTMSSSAFARYLNKDTLDLMVQLYESVYTNSGEKLVTPVKGNYFVRPLSSLKIEQVKVYNLKNNKWKHFSFMDFLDSGALSYWPNT